MASIFQKCLLTSINLHHEMYVPILSKRLCVRLTKIAVAFETSCVQSVLYVFLRRWKTSLYLLVTRFNKSHYLHCTHWNTFTWEKVRRFRQTLKGDHGTIKVKNLNRGLLSGTRCRVVEWSVPDVSRRRISLILKGRNVHWILVDHFQWP